MSRKEYKLPNGKVAVFEYDIFGIGKITLECMDELMGMIADRPQGEWIEFDTKWGRSLYYCTNCMETSEVPTAFGKPLYDFCPNCGADMRNCSEKPNNCEPKICDTCRYYNSYIPCGSTPMACKEADKFAEEFVKSLKKNLKPQFDKDINVRSKDEPQTDGYISGEDFMKIFDEPQTCDTCRFDDRYGDESICSTCARYYSDCYEPKDEPQAGEMMTEEEFDSMLARVLIGKNEPQTEDEILREQCRAFMGIVEQTKREGER